MQSGKFNVGEFIGRNSKEIRFPEIESCAKALKQELGFQKLGAIGFCYGGWAVFQLGAKGIFLSYPILSHPFYEPQPPSHAYIHTYIHTYIPPA